MTPEQLEQLKSSAERAHNVAFSAHLTTESDEYANFIRDATPTAVLDLLAENQRLRAALERIRDHDPFHSEQDPAHVRSGAYCSGCIAATALKEGE